MRYKEPPNSWRKPASCNAGIYFTPALEASQVVPHNRDISASAAKAFALVPLFLMVSGFTLDNVLSTWVLLVFKMPHISHHHGQVIGLTIFN